MYHFHFIVTQPHSFMRSSGYLLSSSTSPPWAKDSQAACDAFLNAYVPHHPRAARHRRHRTVTAHHPPQLRRHQRHQTTFLKRRTIKTVRSGSTVAGITAAVVYSSISIIQLCTATTTITYPAAQARVIIIRSKSSQLFQYPSA